VALQIELQLPQDSISSMPEVQAFASTFSIDIMPQGSSSSDHHVQVAAAADDASGRVEVVTEDDSQFDSNHRPAGGNTIMHIAELEPTASAHSAPLTTPISDCFDWPPVLEKLVHLQGSNTFYLVVFRSVRKATADSELLYTVDAAAQDEARISGGLLQYWYGTLNRQRECLAMCIWKTRQDAINALHKPAHKIAMHLASKMYDTYTLERYWLTHTKTKIEPYYHPQFHLIDSVGM
jgi:hypothetical protein